MSILQRPRDLVTWAPPAPGTPAPALSLTADEGTWIRLPDFKGHVNVVLVFFRSLRDDATDAWLKGFNQRRQQFEDLDTAIFGVTTYRPERLRDYRASLGLEFYLLYDPLGMDARAFHSASRWRPSMKNTAFLIGKDGKVVFSERGLVDPQRVLELAAGLEGADVPVEQHEHTDDFSGVRDPGKAAARVKTVQPDEAVRLLGLADSPFLLLDVRTTSEFEADHAAGAVLIPVDELPHRYRDLGQTTHIICIGQVGDRSVAAAEFLTSIGCSEVYTVEGGMTGWTGERG